MAKHLPETYDLEYIVDPQSFKINYISHTETFLRKVIRDNVKMFLTNTSWGDDETFKTMNIYSKSEKSTQGIFIKSINTTGESIGLDDFMGYHKSRFQLLNHPKFLETNNINNVIDNSVIEVKSDTNIYDGTIDIPIAHYPIVDYKSEIETDMTKIDIVIKDQVYHPVSLNSTNWTLRLPADAISALNNGDTFYVKYIYGNVPVDSKLFKITLVEGDNTYKENEVKLLLDKFQTKDRFVYLYPVELHLSTTITSSVNLKLFVNGIEKERTKDWKYDPIENKITLLSLYGGASSITVQYNLVDINFTYSSTTYGVLNPVTSDITLDMSLATLWTIVVDGKVLTQDDYDQSYSDIILHDVLNKKVEVFSNKKSITPVNTITYATIKNNLTVVFDYPVDEAFCFYNRGYYTLVKSTNNVYVDQFLITYPYKLQIRASLAKETLEFKIVTQDIRHDIIPGLVLEFMEKYYLNEPQYIIYNLFPFEVGKTFGFNAQLTVDMELRMRDMPSITKFNESFLPFLKIKLRRILENYGMLVDANISDGGISTEEINNNLNIEKIFIKTYSFNVTSQMLYVDQRRKLPFLIQKFLFSVS